MVAYSTLLVLHSYLDQPRKFFNGASFKLFRLLPCHHKGNLNSVVYKMYNFCYMSYVLLIFTCEHAAANTLKLVLA